MKNPWLPFAHKNPGPANKGGYGPNWSSRTQAETEGGVYHDAGGGWAALIGELWLDGRRACWNASVPTEPFYVNGVWYDCAQHYPLWGDGSITWHCGVVGDLETRTEVVGNLALVGIEFARPPGNAPAPWTDHQLKVAIKIQQYIDRPEPFELGRNAFEHGWLYATACPSNRNRWDEFEAAMQREVDEDMTPEQFEAAVLKVVARFNHVGHAVALGRTAASTKNLERFIEARFKDFTPIITPDVMEAFPELRLPPDVAGVEDVEGVA